MILVTGGAGFIGANFVLDWLGGCDEPVLNLDKLTYAGNLHNLASLQGDARHIFVQGDIGDTALVDRLLEQFGDDISVLPHDNYYAAHHDLSLEQRQTLNYDHPASFDTDRMIQDLQALRANALDEGSANDRAMAPSSPPVGAPAPSEAAALPGMFEPMREWVERVKRHPLVAHALYANQRFQERLGPQFAGAITYFSVLSLVPVLMFVFAMLGMTMTVLRPDLLYQLTREIRGALGDSAMTEPLVDIVTTSLVSWRSVTTWALLGAGWAGSRWAGHLKRAVRVMWSNEFEDATKRRNFFAELGVNLGVQGGL